MSTVHLCAPTHKSTTLRLVEPPTLSAAPVDPWDCELSDMVVGLVIPSTPEAAYQFGHTHGHQGLDLFTGDLPLDLVEWAYKGFHAGQDDRIERAEFAGSVRVPAAEGVAPWADQPTPDQLAEGLRRIRSGEADLSGNDFAAVFVRQLLESVAGDVELFRCQSFQHWDGRMNVMMAGFGGTR